MGHSNYDLTLYCEAATAVDLLLCHGSYAVFAAALSGKAAVQLCPPCTSTSRIGRWTLASEEEEEVGPWGACSEASTQALGGCHSGMLPQQCVTHHPPTACSPAAAPCTAPVLHAGSCPGVEAAKRSHTYREGAANCIPSGGFCSLNCVILTSCV